MGEFVHALIGIAGLVSLAWVMSEERRAVPWRAVAAGLGLQIGLAVLFLKVEFFKRAFLVLNDALLVLEKATQAGTSLVFGYLGGGYPPFQVSDANSTFILAFRALPLVLVISALSALLFYWRVLPFVVKIISFLLVKTMRVGGVVGLSTAANVFVGMVEAPLFVRPYLARVTRGELFAIMVGGMASIAGTVLFLYASILAPLIPDAVAHLLIASLLSAPAALVVSFVMVPPHAATGGDIDFRSEATSSMDALTRGTLDGAQLLLNIIAMLVVFVALVALVNLVIAPYTLQGMLGWALAPLAWLCGVPWSDAAAAGALLGSKTVLNELIAYLNLASMTSMPERSRVLMTYALCGFANFGSLGIMLGGLGTMCPERRAEIVSLGLKSIVAGTLATCLTAATVALVLNPAEYFRPWKVASLAVGIALLIAGSYFYPAPDWDIPISLIMAAAAYLVAPWSLRVIVERRWKLWPAMLLATWFAVDGCYSLYWYFRNPAALEMMRDANFLASLVLYGMCGVVWYYRGSLRELCAEARALLRR